MKNQNKESLDSTKINLDSLVILNENFSNIKFFEKDHKYTIDDVLAKTSVSGLIKTYEKGFDSTGIAKIVARRDGRSVSEVLEEWNFKRDYSCHKGSEFHLFVENFLERKKISINKDALITFMKDRPVYDDNKFIVQYYNEMAQMISNFINFYDWWKQDHILLKSEFVIGDKETRICGTIDNLSYNKKTKKLSLFDYKTNKEIKLENPRGDRMLSPLDHLQSCELVKYSLQLWLYKLIIERNTPFEVDDSYIVWVAGNDYELFPILDLKKEAETILTS
jgi:ATP-dependent exoDNAse (exonuclease V) beta subunit